jgi:Tol biopolymer transport system component
MKIKLIGFLILLNIYCNSSLSSSTEIVFPKKLTSSNQDRFPAISPDGKYIAFQSARNTIDPKTTEIVHELWIMNKDGSNQRALVSIDGLYETINIKSISWAQNSNDMIVHLYQQNSSEIWRINTNGDKMRLSSPNDWAERPRYSPDGTKIAFLIQGPNPPDSSAIHRLYVTNTDFTEKVLIETGVINDYAWKNDSKELIYSLYDLPNKNLELWKSSINGNEKIQFSNTPADEADVSYSTDDKYIVFIARDTQFTQYITYVTYVTPTDIFQPKKVMSNASMPKWIPNSNHLLICYDQILDGKYWSEYRIIDIEGNCIKIIAENCFQCDISKNGEYVSYTLNGNIWIDKLLE